MELPATKRAALVGANGLLAVAAYRELLRFDFGADVTRELEGFFFVPSDANPLVVVALAAWLLYRRAGRLRALPDARGPGSLAAGLALAGAGAGVAAWSTLTAAADLLAVSASCNGLAWAILRKGLPGARAVLLPALFLLFALPIPAPLLNELAFQLQLWTSQYSGWILHAAGMPALVSADQIHRLDASFAVIENCSGLRSMETLTMLAVLMIDLFHRHGLHAAALLIAAPAVAFALNGLRVVSLILNPHSDIASVHTLQGVSILLGGLALLYLLDGLLARWLPRDAGGRDARRAPGDDAGADGRGARRWLPTAALAATVLATLAPSPWPAPKLAPIGLRTQIPAALRGWSSSDLELDATFLGTIAMRQSILREYANGADRVILYVGLGNHGRGTRGPFSPKTRVPGSGWVVEWSGATSWGQPPQAVELRSVRKAARRRLVAHWVEGDAGTALESARWLLALDRSPWRRRRDGLVVRLSTELQGAEVEDRERADAALRRFFRMVRRPLDRVGRALVR